jgi:hypothetical protein
MERARQRLVAQQEIRVHTKLLIAKREGKSLRRPRCKSENIKMDLTEAASECSNSRSTSQESLPLLWYLKFHFRVDKSPAGPDPGPLE